MHFRWRWWLFETLVTCNWCYISFVDADGPVLSTQISQWDLTSLFITEAWTTKILNINNDTPLVWGKWHKEFEVNNTNYIDYICKTFPFRNRFTYKHSSCTLSGLCCCMTLVRHISTASSAQPSCAHADICGTENMDHQHFPDSGKKWVTLEIKTHLFCRENAVKTCRFQNDDQLHEPRIFYPSGHWPETVTNVHVSAHFR